MKRRSLALMATTALALSACAPALQEAPIGSAVATPTEWRTDLGVTAPVERDWWDTFGDPQLSYLVEKARANNADVQVAAARVEEARAAELGSRGFLLPSVGARRAASGARFPPGRRRLPSPRSQPSAPPTKSIYSVRTPPASTPQRRVSLPASGAEAARLSAAATASGYITLYARRPAFRP